MLVATCLGLCFAVWLLSVRMCLVAALTQALREVGSIQRTRCREWVERHATREVFSQRVETWIREGLTMDGSINAENDS